MSEGYGNLRDATDLMAISGGGDHEHRQATVHAGPAAGVGLVAWWVMAAGVKVRRFDGQT